LDDTLAEVHYVEATIKTWGDWDWEGGEAAFKRALEINPNYPEALVYYSNLLCYLGRPDEAVAQGERALELDPFNSVNMVIYGTTLAMLGKYEEAIVQHRNALKTSPNDPVARSSLWEIFHFQGRYDEALLEAKAFFTGLDMAPLIEIMEQGYEKEGYSGAMRFVADTMAEFSKETYVSPWYIAYLYGFAREKEKTLEWLEMAYEKKDPMMPYVGYVGVLQGFLLEDPHFQDLLRRMNLADLKNLYPK
jgi:tetratricopeptide (TPR) repeat protein